MCVAPSSEVKLVNSWQRFDSDWKDAHTGTVGKGCGSIKWHEVLDIACGMV